MEFWDYVNKQGPMLVESLGPCWEWLGHYDRKLGYGKYSKRIGGISKSFKAHRYAWEQINGEFPEGLEPDHLCKNRICVNPSHIEPVTHKENIRRGNCPTGINARKVQCAKGHVLIKRPDNDNRYCIICKREYNRLRYWKRKAG